MNMSHHRAVFCREHEPVGGVRVTPKLYPYF